jgi:hypothetical protein
VKARKEGVTSLARTHHGNGYTTRGYGHAFSEAKLQTKALEVSLDTLIQFAGLSGNAVIIALLLHRQIASRAYALAAGQEWPAVKLSVALINACGFTRRDVWRALSQLERAGLVRVHRSPGKLSIVTVLWHPIRELSFAPADDEEEVRSRGPTQPRP